MIPKITAALNARLEAFEEDVVSKTCVATSEDGSRWTPTRPPAVVYSYSSWQVLFNTRFCIHPNVLICGHS